MSTSNRRMVSCTGKRRDKSRAKIMKKQAGKGASRVETHFTCDPWTRPSLRLTTASGSSSSSSHSQSEREAAIAASSLCPEAPVGHQAEFFPLRFTDRTTRLPFSSHSCLILSFHQCAPVDVQFAFYLDTNFTPFHPSSVADDTCVTVSPNGPAVARLPLDSAIPNR